MNILKKTQLKFEHNISCCHYFPSLSYTCMAKHFCLFYANAIASKIIPTVSPAQRAIGEKDDSLKEGLYGYLLRLNNSLIPHAVFSAIAVTNNSV